MKIVTSWMREGTEQGLEQELEQEHQGQLKLVTKLISAQLGQLPSMLRCQTEGLTSSQLEKLSEQLLNFQAINTLDSWLTTLEASEGFESEKADALQ